MAKRVAYQGIRGSFSSMAATALFGPGLEPIQTIRFRDIFGHVVSGQADIGVVPLENAIAGSVHENYDLLGEFPVSIIAEAYLPVELHLMSLPGSDLGRIQQVLSHPKALEQCSKFLEERPSLSQVIYSDTAGAAFEVRRRGDASLAAIASEDAAREHGLQVIASSIQNHALNATRFVAISATPNAEAKVDKCSLLFTLPHRPGSLAQILAGVAELEGNITKIESRPMPGKPFEYAFYVDILAPQGRDDCISRCVGAISDNAASCRVLGRYRAAPPLF